MNITSRREVNAILPCIAKEQGSGVEGSRALLNTHEGGLELNNLDFCLYFGVVLDVYGVS